MPRLRYSRLTGDSPLTCAALTSRHCCFSLTLPRLTSFYVASPHYISLAVACGCSFAPYFAEPVIAGLDEEGKPFITATDLIGAAVSTDDFVVAGTCGENLYGMCESLYRKDMNPDELFEVVSQALLSAVDRDALSGWGAVVHIVTPEGVTTRELKGRMD